MIDQAQEMSAAAPADSRQRVYVETFGCQMNELDSELVRGQLGALGYRFVDAAERADVILYNTCSVREQAEQKVWSRLGILGKRRLGGGLEAKFVLGVIGCMAEREGAAMLRKFPHVDFLCGPGELDKIPLLIDNALRTGAAERAEADDLARRVVLQGNTHRRSATLAAAGDNLEMLDLARAFDPDWAESGGRSAYVRITRGCNKFCTYCVVPYTRGAEVHRPPDAIIDECRRLADAGVIEVTLLGQTVNHYSYVHGTAVSTAGIELPQVGASARRTNGAVSSTARVTTFADLLRRIHEEAPAIQRLRFVTSYPRDFGDDVLQVMRDSPRICRYLHVPAQSGSNRILKLMNRGYTVEQYLEFIERSREFLPDVCIAGDIIVGFPSETDADFEQTCDLVRRVRFKNNFIFKYSPRPGTTAMERLADDVPEEVKRRRNNQLLALQAESSALVHRAYVGCDVRVFVERISEERAAPRRGNIELRWEARAADVAARVGAVQVCGRTEGDLIAVFDAPSRAAATALIGRIIPVRVRDCAPLLLRCEMVDESTPSAARTKAAALAAPA